VEDIAVVSTLICSTDSPHGFRSLSPSNNGIINSRPLRHVAGQERARLSPRIPGPLTRYETLGVSTDAPHLRHTNVSSSSIPGTQFAVSHYGQIAIALPVDGSQTGSFTRSAMAASSLRAWRTGRSGLLPLCTRCHREALTVSTSKRCLASWGYCNSAELR
jgi:hypothetical protein